MAESLSVDSFEEKFSKENKIKPALTGGYDNGFGKTQRIDMWWQEPLLTVVGLGLFIIYATWAALQGNHYFYDPYISPFYAPPVFVDPSVAGAAPVSHALFGSWPKWWPAFLPVSPALFILVFPGVFRMTCYYYRKAYYRSFMATPPACGVEPFKQNNYTGETTLFLFQNLHRYAMYAAVVFIIILSYDAFIAFFKDGVFGVGVGSIVLTINAALLAAYTFGCHSIRHLIGGKFDSFGVCDGSGNCGNKIGSPCHTKWKAVTYLNERHMKFAWISLFWVGFTDLYIRLVSMGIIHDFSTWKGF